MNKNKFKIDLKLTFIFISLILIVIFCEEILRNFSNFFTLKGTVNRYLNFLFDKSDITIFSSSFVLGYTFACFLVTIFGSLVYSIVKMYRHELKLEFYLIWYLIYVAYAAFGLFIFLRFFPEDKIINISYSTYYFLGLIVINIIYDSVQFITKSLISYFSIRTFVYFMISLVSKIIGYIIGIYLLIQFVDGAGENSPISQLFLKNKFVDKVNEMFFVQSFKSALMLFIIVFVAIVLMVSNWVYYYYLNKERKIFSNCFFNVALCFIALFLSNLIYLLFMLITQKVSTGFIIIDNTRHWTYLIFGVVLLIWIVANSIIFWTVPSYRSNKSLFTFIMYLTTLIFAGSMIIFRIYEKERFSAITSLLIGSALTFVNIVNWILLRKKLNYRHSIFVIISSVLLAGSLLVSAVDILLVNHQNTSISFIPSPYTIPDYLLFVVAGVSLIFSTYQIIAWVISIIRLLKFKKKGIAYE
ncbi:hypothetical protein HUN03_00226 [Mycoplasmopsis anatis]|uniref:MSC_0624 family F1-like ATPase-associated membrane protein n=1 Tax=Mycoplasmopsis anatis TaxID=171279 RepID=UPI001C4DF89D|nr:hypothetical protein [Mycoplasmopsis anatis]MBW0594862.1 hypothetical protein [Mycoplasmopsis anatis]MBW0595553.1 hypothetical protein [Mycoplasmopsis anatis]MBW0598460.1 hypothetical protein [Mycoplasmopsis anatis]MBW0599241.1 hypothetical protein [Mycoplasmopsis anatis]MBW0601438.1 hypothetical protein [Mycoplasmopsis anatis]